MTAGVGPGSRSPRRFGAALALLVVAFVAMAACARSRSVAEPSPSPTIWGLWTVAPPVDRSDFVPRPPRFPSIAKALVFIRRHLDGVRVVLPDGLPEGIALDPKHPVYRFGSTTRTGWMLQLVYGRNKHLDIQYGLGMFDGCGPVAPREARVGGRPALFDTTHRESVWWTELIWPATPERPFGRYGLTGNFPPERMLRIARSMPPIPPPKEVSNNC